MVEIEEARTPFPLLFREGWEGERGREEVVVGKVVMKRFLRVSVKWREREAG